MAVLIPHLEGWRRRPGPTTSPVPAGTRCRSAGALPPTSRTHRGAPTEDCRIAGDAADGDAIKGGAGTKLEVDVKRVIIRDGGRIRWDGGEGDGASPIRQDARAVVLNAQPTGDDGRGAVAEVQAGGVVLDDELACAKGARNDASADQDSSDPIIAGGDDVGAAAKITTQNG